MEANTFLLPITEGCTHNSCMFCNMYQDIPFRMLSRSEVEEYLWEVKQSQILINDLSFTIISEHRITLPCMEVIGASDAEEAGNIMKVSLEKLTRSL